MAVYHAFLDRQENQGFLPLDEHEVSDFEKHLRFLYSVRTLMRNIDNEYNLFKGELPIKASSGMGPMRIDYQLWYSKNGTPGILMTEIVSGPMNIMLYRAYKNDPLYKEFELATQNPPQSLELTFDSGNEEEFGRLIKIFNKACNDLSWKYQMPRFLRSRTPI